MTRQALFSIILLLSLLAPFGQERLFTQTAPDPRFGMTEVFWSPEDAVELGVGWERILFYWRELQPSGPDDWNTLHVREEWLAQANAQGRTVVGLLKNTAPWASEDGTEAGVPKGLYLAIDDPGNLWATFLRRVARYYGERNVHHWIIWNEPEIRPGTYGYEFAGNAKDYYQLLKVAYQVLKAEDPEAIIHLAGLTWWHNQQYLANLLDIALADPEGSENDYFFDVISLHIYFRVETIRTIVDEVNRAQQVRGMDKPIWINETNAPPNKDPQWPVQRPTFDIDLEQQAWFVIQAFSLGFSSGADRISLYKLLDVHLPPGGESFGVLRPDKSRRPAYESYKLLTHLLGGFTEVRREQGSEYFIITFIRPTGITRVLWSRTAATQYLNIAPTNNGQTSGEALLVNAFGERTVITPEDGVYSLELKGARCSGECIIGGAPLILVEERSVALKAITGISVDMNPTTPPAPVSIQNEIGNFGPDVAVVPSVTPTSSISAETPTIPSTATNLAAIRPASIVTRESISGELDNNSKPREGTPVALEGTGEDHGGDKQITPSNHEGQLSVGQQTQQSKGFWVGIGGAALFAIALVVAAVIVILRRG